MQTAMRLPSLISSSSPLSHRRSLVKSAEAADDVVERRWSWSSVIDSDELVGRMSLVSRLPQYCGGRATERGRGASEGDASEYGAAYGGGRPRLRGRAGSVPRTIKGGGATRAARARAEAPAGLRRRGTHLDAGNVDGRRGRSSVDRHRVRGSKGAKREVFGSRGGGAGTREGGAWVDAKRRGACGRAPVQRLECVVDEGHWAHRSAGQRSQRSVKRGRSSRSRVLPSRASEARQRGRQGRLQRTRARAGRRAVDDDGMSARKPRSRRRQGSSSERRV